MTSARRRNFHVPLDESLHEQLRREAARTGKPATELARDAIETALRERQRTQLHESIAAYASSVAGTTDDLDTALERAAIEHLAGRKRRRS